MDVSAPVRGLFFARRSQSNRGYDLHSFSNLLSALAAKGTGTWESGDYPARLESMIHAKACRGDADLTCMATEAGNKRSATIPCTALVCWLVAVPSLCRVVAAADEKVPPGSGSPQGVAELFGQAKRAREEGLVEDAQALYREVLACDPEHNKAFEGLVQLVGLRPLNVDSNSYRAARELLPRRFREFETRHYVILSDTGRRRARERGDLLERTHGQFLRYAGRLELRPLPLRNKLVCVLFRKRSDFAAFARENDGVAATWCLGYYSPQHDRAVFFDVESERGADEFAEARAVAATVHEAVHQLHYHTRIQKTTVQYPFWSGEGLATAFETSSPDEQFGPEYDFRPRRERFVRLLEADRLIPLQLFVGLDQMPDGRRETVHTVYNQSYALASWLARERPGELRAYLFAMLKEPPGQPTSQRHLALFEQAFGDVDAVEEAWLRRETSLENVR